jgi:hypothetical protein
MPLPSNVILTMTWAVYVAATLAMVAAVVVIGLVLVKKVQLEKAKGQMLKEAKALATAEAEADLNMLTGKPRAQKKRAAADVKAMKTQVQNFSGFVAILEREFRDYKARFGKLALILLVIGVAGFSAQFLMMYLQGSAA